MERIYSKNRQQFKGFVLKLSLRDRMSTYRAVIPEMSNNRPPGSVEPPIIRLIFHTLYALN